MKVLMIMAALLMATTSFAGLSSKDKEEIKDNTAQAKKVFKKMMANGAGLAELESEFNVKGGLSPMPTLGFYSLRYMCKNGNTIQSTRLIKKCIEWSVDFEDKRGNEWTKTFSSQFQASLAEDDRDADSDAYCSAKSAGEIYTHPINYQAKGCVTWGVDFKDKRDNEWTKTFSNYFQASLAEDDRDADSDAYCVEKGIVNKTVPTSVSLSVYRKQTVADPRPRLEKDSDKLLVGKVKYSIPACNGSDQ